MHVRQVEKEGLRAILPQEADRFLHVALRERALVRLFLDDLFVADQRQRRVVRVGLHLPSHVVAVGQPIIAVEPMAGGQELRLVAAVPLPDHLRGIALLPQQGCDRDLIWVQAHSLPGKEHPLSIEAAKANARWIAPRKHRPARGRTHGRGRVEISKAHPLGSHPIQRRRAIHLRAIAAKVPIAQVIAVHKNDIWWLRHNRILSPLYLARVLCFSVLRQSTTRRFRWAEETGTRLSN